MGITIKCDNCDDEFDDSIVCTLCQEKNIVDNFKQGIKYIFSHYNYLWEDKEGYCGFESEVEKEIFMEGIKYGFHQALFWMSDYIGEVEFFEKLTEKKEDSK